MRHPGDISGVTREQNELSGTTETRPNAGSHGKKFFLITI